MALQLLPNLMPCADPERGGGQGVRTPSGKIQKYRVPLQYWSGSPENHKATNPAFNVSHHRPASETPLKWRFAGGPLMTR